MESNNPEQHQNFKTKDLRSTLTDILKTEEIHSISELSNAQLAYCISYFGDKSGNAPANRDEIISKENRRIRRYTLRKVFDYLFPTSEPKSIVEFGSAGDASVALEFPNAQVYSVDDDVNMFKFNILDNIPTELFKAMGLKKPGIIQLAFQYPFIKRRLNNLLHEAMPNLSLHIEDAKKIIIKIGNF